MKETQCGCCPGCKRHCPACKPCCKYGRKYFAELEAQPKANKLSEYTEKGGLARELLKTCKALKKTLKKEKRTEKDIFAAFTPQDSETFANLLILLKKQLDYS